jgi:hypothetical protein
MSPYSHAGSKGLAGKSAPSMGEVGKVNGLTFVDGLGGGCVVGELRIWNGRPRYIECG